MPLRPAFARVHQRQVKFPQQPRQDHTHLVERQILADAVPRSEAKWFVDGSLVVEEWRIGIALSGGEPSLGKELPASVPVARGSESRELRNSDFGLLSGTVSV